MNSKKIVALLLCLGLSFQSTALSGVLYDENAVLKASAEGSGKTADAESYSGTEQSENKAQRTESSADKADETQHAYDPISDMEAEQEYRDSTEITPGKVLFSVLSYHAEGEESAYLDDDSDICAEYDLKDVEFVLETKAENTAEKDGMTPYKTFYEATTSEDVWATVDKLSDDDNILSAEPDFVWEKTDTTTVAATDEEINAETHFPCMDVTGVWKDCFDPAKKEAPGKGTVVAVIDTGVDYTHKDLEDNIWVNEGEIPGNGIDDDGNGYVDDVHGVDFVDGDSDPMDEHGHGTHVAGIIAMTPGNGGGVGVAYGAKIMCVRAGQANGSFASSDIAKAIKYAADNGADVINMSFGGTGRSYLVESALQDAFPSCVLVAAAGNDGLPTTDAINAGYFNTEDIYPAGYKYVLGVMATDNNQSLAYFSNWDFAEGSGCEYEMAAPGVNIYSTLPGNRYACWSGTSMATPNVAAAAAILRSKYTDKSKYSSRYIMGQLCSATSSRVDFWGKFGDHHSYPVLNIRDSLTKQAQPNLSLDEVYTLDYQDVSSVNNGDGIAQPGETIDMGVAIWNRWGAATDVTVKVDADSVGGVANKYVEFINDEVKLSDVGTFASVNNGFTYTDEKLTGVSNPIRFKIKEGTPNDIQITFNISITAKNGLDERDGNLYSSSTSYTLTVQNGVALSGIINEDMTLTNDKLWILENNVLIPEGVTVTVEPGTRIQFWSADPNNKYGANSKVYLQVEGRFIAEGTEEQPIEMYPGKGYEYKEVTITGNGQNSSMPDLNILDDNYENTYSSLAYVNIVNADSMMLTGVYGKSFNVTKIDHCNLVMNESDSLGYIYIYADSITNSRFVNYIDYISGGYSPIAARNITSCIFDNCKAEIITKTSFCNNVVLNYNYQNNYSSLPIGTTLVGFEFPYVFNSMSNNSILNSFYLNNYDDIRTVSSVYVSDDRNGRHAYDISGNYWGTTNPDLVKVQCLDADWDVSRNDLIQEPYLTLDDDMSDIYPFVTEAYLTDKDGNRIDKVSGAQTVKMHVKFNRDMASDVQPMVTYGGSEPYTDFAVSGDWANAREWVSEFKIDPYIDLGTMYIRIKGAAAADDKWLVTGNDWGRFKFEITNSSAQSMSLTGEGQLGKNALSWMQDDYDTLAGYNIYRATKYDAGKKPEEQKFTKVNKSVLNADELSFIDENVKAGTDYYYYFTVVDTDLNESKASNVISCCPLEGEPPVIVHTPVKTLTPDKAIAITADITDNVKVAGATLYYKNKSADSWKSVDMRNTKGSVYKATIAAYEVKDEEILYYITATDGTNVVYCGTADEPNVIVPHYLTRKITKKATCTEDGVITYTCTECNESYTEKIPATGHKYNDVVTEASCDKGGYTLHTCANCGDTYKDDFTAPTGHKYTKTTVKQPSCDTDGVSIYTCDTCGDSYSEVIKAKGHIYASEVTKKANCTDDGVITYTCAICGDKYTEVIKAKGHNYSAEVTKKANCTDDEVITYTCANCGDKYTEVIKAKGHNYSAEVTKKATCDTDGVKTFTCADCGDVYTEKLEALGHTYGISEVVKPTCDNDGYTKFTCSVCGDSYSKVINATGHKYNDKIVSASCDKSGYTLHTCENCGDIYKDNFTSPLGHDYTSQTVKPACETDGEKTFTCTRCGDTYTEVIKAKGHVYKRTVVATGCETDGYTLVECMECHDSFKEDYVAAKGHTIVTDKAVAATCTTSGKTEGSHCSVCGKVIKAQTEIKAKGHVAGDWITDKAAAVGVKGRKHRSCTVCGAVVETADIPALSPKSISSATVSLSIATCSFDGKVKTPSVTVKLGSTALRNGIDYVVSYSNNKNVGKATVVITGKGLYAGTITRTFVINPAKQEIQKLTAKSKGFYIDYAAKGHATGYEIQYATNSSFSGAKKTVITSNKTDKVTVSKLSGNKKYYVRVRTYTTVNGIKYYGAWSAVKTVTTKK